MNKSWRREAWRTRGPDVAAMSVFLLLFLLFFGPIIISGKFFVMSDAFVYSYPMRVVAWDAIRHASLPLWTPFLMSGYPLLSMAQLGIGYPLTWGYLFLPGPLAEELYVLAPYLFAPAFTYAYAREMGRSRIASMLAGLSFGYGGAMVMPYINNGMMTNALMWLPLMLIAIERARTRRFITCLLWATGAYTMSVLTGIGQGFLFVGLLALAYAAFVCVFRRGVDQEESGAMRGWLDHKRWSPLAVMAGAIMLSAGVAAFQILETMVAQRRSIRSVLDYETLGEGSFTLPSAWRSLVAPLYDFLDMTAYVPLLAVGLAVFGILAAMRSQRRDVRVFFWAATAALAWVLMLGVNTPLYRLIYYVPVLNRFRAPSRHAFEWTFAVSILSAYGWDAFGPIASRVKERLAHTLQRRDIFTALNLLMVSFVVGVVWWKLAERVQKINPEIHTSLHESAYLWLKMIFTLLVILLIWQSWRVAAPVWRNVLLACACVLACFVEPFIMVSGWWWPMAKPASRFTNASPATRFLQQFPPEQNRVYTRVELFAEEYSAAPVLDPPNLTALYGLHNVAGYEPLISERYSRALGNVWLDTINLRRGFAPDQKLFEQSSHVLDLLNTKFIVTYSNPSMPFGKTIEKEGIKFATNVDKINLKPGESATLSAMKTEADQLVLVTGLAHSGAAVQGMPVAKLRVFTVDGRFIERELRAGVETAEWAHERADVRDNVRHSLAPIFEGHPGDAANSFTAYSYWSRTPLGQRLTVDKVEIVNITQSVLLVVANATLYDSTRSYSRPLSPYFAHYDLTKWQPVYETNDVVIVRNERALPRAWLVAEAEAVDAEEALRRIRGESERPFDPTRTALLEIAPQELPRLPGGPIAAHATARIVAYESNRLTIETDADQPAVLVLSEINYPGWEAMLDGKETPIYQTDFLLRGMALPAGQHRIVMQYKPVAARHGALFSIFTILLICGLAVYARHSRAR